MYPVFSTPTKKHSIPDYYYLWTPLWVTCVAMAIFLCCSVLADAASLPFQLALGANGKQICDASNATLIREMGMLIPASGIVIFAFSYLFLGYIDHGFKDGILTLPKKKSA